MDGNRRWAAAKGLASYKGHVAGYQKVKEVLAWCQEAGIKILTLYAFSTENWQRAQKEVNFLMRLFYLALTKEIKELDKNDARVRIIGERQGLTAELRAAINKAEEITKNNRGTILNLALNYGGRQEIVAAVNKIWKNKPAKVSEEIINKNIYTAGLPEPDLIIRTSGEQRLSGFLMWQAVYSELSFVKNYWPEFSKEDFTVAIDDYYQRKRRFGR